MPKKYIYSLTVLFMQVILDCLSFRRWMDPMEHSKQPPVVYGKVFFSCLFVGGFFPKYLCYPLMHQKFFWGDRFSKSGGHGVTYILLSWIVSHVSL